MYLRRILSILGGLFGLAGLALARRTITQAVRRISPLYSVQIVGPAAAGKTTLFRYLRHEPLAQELRRTMSRRRTGRIAADLSGTITYFALSTVSDEVVHEPTTSRVWFLRKYYPDGMVLIIDTHNPTAERAYFQALYERYHEFSTQRALGKLRVLLVLLNKFDLWGRTGEAREAMLHRYRSEVFQDLVTQFRSRFGVTVQWGCTSLTQAEHTPYNNVILKEFLTAVAQRG